MFSKFSIYSLLLCLKFCQCKQSCTMSVFRVAGRAINIFYLRGRKTVSTTDVSDVLSLVQTLAHLPLGQPL